MKVHGADNIYSMMYYNHNLEFGAASYAMEGRFAEAKKMADESRGTAVADRQRRCRCSSRSRRSVAQSSDAFRQMEDEVRTPAAEAGPLSTTLSHFARGVALARMGDVTGAQREHEQFEESRKSLTDDPGIMQNSPKAIGRVASAVLDGRIAEANGDRAKAIRAYRRAVETEDTLDYDEPADWFYPTRETLGAALVRDGQFAEAEKVFREDLQRNPNNPRSLFGLAEALRKQKKNSKTAAAQFKKYWHGGALNIEDCGVRRLPARPQSLSPQA